MATVNRRVEWRAELRRLLLTDELLTLPEVVRGLADQVVGLTEQVRGLVAAQRRTDDRLGRLEGRDLEHWHRERASSVFRRILGRARLVDHGELAPRATGRPVVPVVAGERVAAGVAEEARAAGVWRLLDGRAEMEPSPTA